MQQTHEQTDRRMDGQKKWQGKRYYNQKCKINKKWGTGCLASTKFNRYHNIPITNNYLKNIYTKLFEK